VDKIQLYFAQTPVFSVGFSGVGTGGLHKYSIAYLQNKVKKNIWKNFNLSWNKLIYIVRDKTNIMKHKAATAEINRQFIW